MLNTKKFFLILSLTFWRKYSDIQKRHDLIISDKKIIYKKNYIIDKNKQKKYSDFISWLYIKVWKRSKITLNLSNGIFVFYN